MADVSDRRREPKGIPTGGEFAKEDSGAADAADLEEAAFERAEREADEYYSSLTDEELGRQWAEEFGRTPGSEADSPGPTTTEGRRDSERQRAERTGSHPIPKPPAAPKGGTGPGVEPERDRLWNALADQHAGRGTRARLARDRRLLALLGADGDTRPVAALGSWGTALEWLGSDGRVHTSPLASPRTVGMGCPAYEEYDGYSHRLAALRGHMPESDRRNLADGFGRLRVRQVAAEAGLDGWTDTDASFKLSVVATLDAAEAEAGRSGADSGVRKTPPPARKRSGPVRPEPRHPRLVRFASTVGKAGAVVLGGFLGVVRRVLAPLSRR